MGCSCSTKQWDPVCAYNGMTYASPCLAGCQTSTGFGKEMVRQKLCKSSIKRDDWLWVKSKCPNVTVRVSFLKCFLLNTWNKHTAESAYLHPCPPAFQVFHNCTCVGDMMTPSMNMSAVLGLCPRKSDCDDVFKVYMALSTLGSFISACGSTPGYIVLLRCEVYWGRARACVQTLQREHALSYYRLGFISLLKYTLMLSSRSIHKDLKSLALGMQTLIVRTLGEYISPLSKFSTIDAFSALTPLGVCVLFLDILKFCSPFWAAATSRLLLQLRLRTKLPPFCQTVFSTTDCYDVADKFSKKNVIGPSRKLRYFLNIIISICQ